MFANQDIVILSPEKPSHETWSRLRHFPGVYFIQGTQKNRKDLVRVLRFPIARPECRTTENIASDLSMYIYITGTRRGSRVGYGCHYQHAGNFISGSE